MSAPQISRTESRNERSYVMFRSFRYVSSRSPSMIVQLRSDCCSFRKRSADASPTFAMPVRDSGRHTTVHAQARLQSTPYTRRHTTYSYGRSYQQLSSEQWTLNSERRTGIDREGAEIMSSNASAALLFINHAASARRRKIQSATALPLRAGLWSNTRAIATRCGGNLEISQMNACYEYSTSTGTNTYSYTDTRVLNSQ